MYKISIILISLVFSNNAYSGNATGKVTTIFVADNSFHVLFVLDSNINDTPRCNEEKRFSLSLQKPGGFAAYTAILEAKREGYQVNVEGLNTCINEWKSEDIKNIKLN